MIKTVNMQGFTCFDEKVLNFVNGVNVITGRNHAGKSSVRQAIRYALTAQPDKKDPDEIISNREGAKCRVSLTCDYDGKQHMIVRKAKPHTLELNNTKLNIGKSSDKDGLFEHGYKRNVIKMLCDATNFFELSAKEQADLLMNYFASDEVIDVTAHGLSKKESEKIGTLTTGNIKQRAAELRESRYSINKVIDGIKHEIEIITRNNSEGGAIDSTVHDRIEEIENELKKIRPETTPIAPADLMQIEKELRLFKTHDYQPKHAARLSEISAKGKANKSIIESYKTYKGKCPISCGKIDCNEPGLAKFIENLEAENSCLREEYEKLAAEDETNCAQYNQEKNQNIAEWEKKYNAIKSEWESKSAAIEEKNKKAFDLINVLNAELKGLNEKIQGFKKRDNDLNRLSQLDKDLSQLQKESKMYDKIISFIESDLKQSIVSNGAEDFFKKVNYISKQFGFEIESDGDITNLKVNNKTLAMLSTSERIICGISLQIAIATISGHKFFVADDLESINENYYFILVDMLQRHFKNITSILIGRNLENVTGIKNFIIMKNQPHQIAAE